MNKLKTATLTGLLSVVPLQVRSNTTEQLEIAKIVQECGEKIQRNDNKKEYHVLNHNGNLFVKLVTYQAAPLTTLTYEMEYVRSDSETLKKLKKVCYE